MDGQNLFVSDDPDEIKKSQPGQEAALKAEQFLAEPAEGAIRP